jgi:DNA-binding NtrC family response regulator
MRVGSNKARKVDVRVIVATHRDLKQRAREGLFREDLYYRLAVVPLPIPPLRERREDLPALCQLFLVQAARDLKVPVRRLSPEAMCVLLNYDFPGNVRELRNLIERAFILSSGDEIGVENFPMAAQTLVRPEAVAEMMPQPFDLRVFLSELEKALVLRVLGTTGGAQAEASRRLGLSRSDLSYKLGKYGTRTPRE